VTPHTVTLEEADKSVDTSEQHDPMFQGIGGMNVSFIDFYDLKKLNTH
jgi:hypothetical protein